jgi:hypothetical protein
MQRQKSNAYTIKRVIHHCWELGKSKTFHLPHAGFSTEDQTDYALKNKAG